MEEGVWCSHYVPISKTMNLLVSFAGSIEGHPPPRSLSSFYIPQATPTAPFFISFYHYHYLNTKSSYLFQIQSPLLTHVCLLWNRYCPRYLVHIRERYVQKSLLSRSLHSSRNEKLSTILRAEQAEMTPLSVVLWQSAHVQPCILCTAQLPGAPFT